MARVTKQETFAGGSTCTHYHTGEKRYKITPGQGQGKGSGRRKGEDVDAYRAGYDGIDWGKGDAKA